MVMKFGKLLDEYKENYAQNRTERPEYKILICNNCSSEIIEAIKSLTEFLGNTIINGGTVTQNKVYINSDSNGYLLAEKAEHMKEIGKLRGAADRAGRWADKNPNPDKLYGRIIIAAIWIALIPVAGKYIVIGISALLVCHVVAYRHSSTVPIRASHC